MALFGYAAGHPLEIDLEKKFEVTLMRAILMDPRCRQVIPQTFVICVPRAVPVRGHRRCGHDFGGPSPETLHVGSVTPGVVPRGGWEVRPSARDAAEPTPSTDSPYEG